MRAVERPLTGHLRGHRHPAHIGRYDDRPRVERSVQLFRQHTDGAQAVHGDLEEALDLRGVEVDRDEMVDPRGFE
jgi:hypothetical protein